MSDGHDGLSRDGKSNSTSKQRPELIRSVVEGGDGRLDWIGLSNIEGGKFLPKVPVGCANAWV